MLWSFLHSSAAHIWCWVTDIASSTSQELWMTTYQEVVGPDLAGGVQPGLTELHHMFITEIIPGLRPHLILKGTKTSTDHLEKCHHTHMDTLRLTQTHSDSHRLTQTHSHSTWVHLQVSTPHSDSNSAPWWASLSGWLWCYLCCDLSPPCGRRMRQKKRESHFTVRQIHCYL